MLTLELFIFPGCVCERSAIALAKKAVKEVSGIQLILRSDPADRDRARALGIAISPTFVLEGEICAIGEPGLEGLVQQLRDRLSSGEMSPNPGAPSS